MKYLASLPHIELVRYLDKVGTEFKVFYSNKWVPDDHPNETYLILVLFLEIKPAFS